MILVIAEKPSVAQSIAKVLGATSRKDGYMEGGNYIVSWCFGHLVELADASSYDERYAKWRYDDLPIVPESWMFEVTKDKAQQFKVLSALMKDKRVTELVCATDAGREGELTAADQDLLARLHPQNIADMVDIRALNPDFFRPDLVRFHKKMVHDYFFLAVTETHSP